MPNFNVIKVLGLIKVCHMQVALGLKRAMLIIALFIINQVGSTELERETLPRWKAWNNNRDPIKKAASY